MLRVLVSEHACLWKSKGEEERKMSSKHCFHFNPIFLKKVPRASGGFHYDLPSTILPDTQCHREQQWWSVYPNCSPVKSSQSQRKPKNMFLEID